MTGHSHVLLDEVSGAALCLAAYMPAAILICEAGSGYLGGVAVTDAGRLSRAAPPGLQEVAEPSGWPVAAEDPDHQSGREPYPVRGACGVRQFSEDLVTLHGRCPCAGCEPDHHVRPVVIVSIPAAGSRDRPVGMLQGAAA